VEVEQVELVILGKPTVMQPELMRHSSANQQRVELDYLHQLMEQLPLEVVVEVVVMKLMLRRICQFWVVTVVVVMDGTPTWPGQMLQLLVLLILVVVVVVTMVVVNLVVQVLSLFDT
jgi:hypothetical protein